MKNEAALHTVVGPAGAGKTAHVLSLAAERLREPTPHRVGVVTLPQARRHLLARFAREQGGAPGFKVLHWQALYTEILAELGRLGPPLDALERIALVGEALREVDGRTPGPGEAGLFARAIAELKRYGVEPDDVPEPDREAARLREVYARYEALRQGRRYQDPDDRRSEALEHLGELERPPYATLIVDGFRELSPVEARFLKAYAKLGGEVVVTSPAPVPTLPTSQLLEESHVELERFALPNVVEEARWVMARVKRLLLDGVPPSEIVVVTPPGLASHYRHFAQRFDVPLADEHTESLADLDEGRHLLDRLALADHPTADALRRVPGLEPLAARLYALGVSGMEATERLAAELGLEERFEEARRMLEPEPSEDPEDWVRRLIQEDPVLASSPWADEFMRAGFLAARFVNGHDYDPARMRDWWRALLGTLRPVRQEARGVAFTTAGRLGGRRFEHAFIAGAFAGAYLTGEQEDYFLPDDPGVRLPWDAAFEELGLPERLRNRTLSLWDELRGAGRTTTLTFPLASASGPVEPEVALIGTKKEKVPLAGPTPLPAKRKEGIYGPPEVAAPLTHRHVDQVRALDKCGYQAFLYRMNLGEEDEDALGWYELLERLKRDPKDLVALAGLGLDPREVGAGWNFLPEFEVKEVFNGETVDFQVKLHVVVSDAKTAEIIYVTPKEIKDVDAAKRHVGKYPSYALAVRRLVRAGRAVYVSVHSIPLRRRIRVRKGAFEDWIFTHGGTVKSFQRRVERAVRLLREAESGKYRLAANDWACRTCRFADICRHRVTRRKGSA